ncbi:MAG TPA: flagellin [bacterium]|nr:flagellin [bacterium]
MALRIVNNVAAINAQRNLANTQRKLETSLERLSSGLRINRAADDAAGLAISQQFRGDLAAYGAAENNVAQGNAMLQVAEGGLDQIHGMLTRLKELATQAASDNTVNASALDDEAQELVAEINRTAKSTEYSGIYLLDGSYASGTATVDIQVGSSNTSVHRLSFNIEAATAGAIGVTGGGNGLNDVNLNSIASAQGTMDIADQAISDVSTVRAKIGASQNRLSYTANNLSTTIENISASESVIRDADIAATMTSFTKNQILRQAGTAMLAQANAMPQAALTLLG